MGGESKTLGGGSGALEAPSEKPGGMEGDGHAGGKTGAADRKGQKKGAAGAFEQSRAFMARLAIAAHGCPVKDRRVSKVGIKTPFCSDQI
eukprot:314483-Pelagomonas_calceolata.AAC.1